MLPVGLAFPFSLLFRKPALFISSFRPFSVTLTAHNPLWHIWSWPFLCFLHHVRTSYVFYLRRCVCLVSVKLLCTNSPFSAGNSSGLAMGRPENCHGWAGPRGLKNKNLKDRAGPRPIIWNFDGPGLAAAHVKILMGRARPRLII